MSQQLTTEYHRARTQTVLFAAAVYAFRYSFSLPEKIPVLNIQWPEGIHAEYLLAVALLYALIRLGIEWFQSSPEARTRRASKVDIGVTFVIATPAFLLVIWDVLRRFGLADDFLVAIPWLPVLFLTVLGVAVGELLTIWIGNLFLIRSKEEARRLALPRVPVAVRATFRLAYILGPVVGATLALSPSFSEPLASLWQWLIIAPCLLWMIAGLPSTLSGIEAMRKAVNVHDTMYQIGGFDDPIAPADAPLYAAAEKGDSKAVQTLLDEGARPDVVNTAGWTPLMIAAANRHDHVATVLLERGADPNIPNLLGRSALMFASRYGNEGLVKALLQHGADPDCVPITRDPGALGIAAANGHAEIVGLLLDAGASPDVADTAGRTPVDYAEDAKNGQVAAILRRASRNRRQQEPDQEQSDTNR